MKNLGTANLLEIKRWFNDVKTMGIVPDMEIPVDVVCDEDPLRREWFSITGLENSGDSLRIVVKRYK
jgi:hypothetical protein